MESAWRRGGPEAKFENDATALLPIHSGRRMSDQILPASTTRRRQSLEARRDGWLRTVDDFEAFCHHTEGAFLAQPQVHRVVATVIGMSFNHH